MLRLCFTALQTIYIYMLYIYLRKKLKVKEEKKRAEHQAKDGISEEWRKYSGKSYQTAFRDA